MSAENSSVTDMTTAHIGGHRPPLQFELNASYVSLFGMSCGPRRDSACLAQIKEVEEITHVSNEKAGTITTAEPRIERETQSEQELDLPRQGVDHHEPVNLMS